MIEGVPVYVSAVFILTTVMTVGFLFYAVKQSAFDTFPGKLVLALVSFWLFFQAILAAGGFYAAPTDPFPRFPLFAPVPAILFAAYLLVFHRPAFVERLSLRTLTLLHSVRLPVELVLFWLYSSGQVPRLMTFEGRNPDILVGITAPIMAWIAFKSGKPRRRILLAWNLVSFVFLVNIVVHAVLSLQSPIQQFGFGQPNKAVLFFPYIWLPAVIVPIAAFAHAAAIIQLVRKDNK